MNIMHWDLEEMVVLLSMSLFLFFLGLFLLMVLMEGEPTGSNCSYRSDLLFYLVLVGMLWVFLCIMLLMLQSKNIKINYETKN